MLNLYRYTFVLLVILLIASCKDKAKSTNHIKKSDEVTVAIDSGAFKVNKDDFKIESVVKDQKPSDKSEVLSMVENIDQADLNNYQQFAQRFLKACAEKDYSKAASFLAYKGSDVNRNNKTAYNVVNSNEMSIVKTTVDVVFGFLAESSNYTFALTKEKQVKVGKVQSLEITFFKKGMGINRHYFEIIEVGNEMLIYDMK